MVIVQEVLLEPIIARGRREYTNYITGEFTERWLAWGWGVSIVYMCVYSGFGLDN